jgi:hypothetical protein
MAWRTKTWGWQPHAEKIRSDGEQLGQGLNHETDRLIRDAKAMI